MRRRLRCLTWRIRRCLSPVNIHATQRMIHSARFIAGIPRRRHRHRPPLARHVYTSLRPIRAISSRGSPCRCRRRGMPAYAVRTTYTSILPTVCHTCMLYRTRLLFDPFIENLTFFLSKFAIFIYATNITFNVPFLVLFSKWKTNSEKRKNDWYYYLSVLIKHVG